MSKPKLAFYLSLELLEAIERDAAERGQTLSEWMRRAAEAALRERVEGERAHGG